VESLGGVKIQKQKNQGQNLRSAQRKMNVNLDQRVEIRARAVSNEEHNSRTVEAEQLGKIWPAGTQSAAAASNQKHELSQIV
jgi:hypothetical protein